MKKKLDIKIKLFTPIENELYIINSKDKEIFSEIGGAAFIYLDDNSKPIKKFLIFDYESIIDNELDKEPKIQRPYHQFLTEFFTNYYKSKNKIKIKINNKTIEYQPQFNEIILSKKDIYNISPYLLDTYLIKTKTQSNPMIEIIKEDNECDLCGSHYSYIINFYLHDQKFLSTKHNLINCENSIPFVTGAEIGEFYQELLNGHVEENLFNKILFEYIKNINLDNTNFNFLLEENIQEINNQMKNNLYGLKKVLLKVKILTNIIIESFHVKNFFTKFWLKNLKRQLISSINKNLVNENTNNYTASFLNRKSDSKECCIKYGKDKSLLMACEILDKTLENGKAFRTFASKTYFSKIINNIFILEDMNNNVLLEEDINDISQAKRIDLLEKIRNKIEFLFWK